MLQVIKQEKRSIREGKINIDTDFIPTGCGICASHNCGYDDNDDADDGSITCGIYDNGSGIGEGMHGSDSHDDG